MNFMLLLSYLDGKIDVGQVFHNPVNKALDIIFAQEFGNGLNLEEFPVLVRDESILAEVIRENLGNAVSELFFLLWQIRTCDDLVCMSEQANTV
jgi:hypothetical protein